MVSQRLAGPARARLESASRGVALYVTHSYPMSQVRFRSLQIGGSRSPEYRHETFNSVISDTGTVHEYLPLESALYCIIVLLVGRLVGLNALWRLIIIVLLVGRLVGLNALWRLIVQLMYSYRY